MVKDAYFSMKLSNYCKSKELISTLGGELWRNKKPIPTSEGGKAKHTNTTQFSLLLSFIRAGLCSSLQL